MKKYPFTISILSLFAGMSLILFVFLVCYFYLTGMTQAFKITTTKLQETNVSISSSITELLDNTMDDLAVLSRMSEEQNILQDKNTITKVMWEQLKSNEDLASIFLADTYGNFLQARRSPKLAVREVDNINENPVDTYIYKDNNFATIAIDISRADYDPRTRKWFTLLSTKNPTNWSEPYIFASTGKAGITLSVANLNDSGEITKIAAADFTLDTLSGIINEKSRTIDGDLILFNSDADVIASSDQFDSRHSLSNVSKLSDMPSHRFSNIFEHIKKGETTGKISDNNINYVFFITKVSNTHGKDWYLASFIKEQNILAPIKKTLYSSILYSLLIIVVVYFPVQFFIRKYFIKPIKALKESTQMVAERKFESVQLIDTKIEEFHELSSSMVSMAVSIEVFEAEQALLMDSIVKIMAAAVDDKSHYTGGHCERVPEIAEMLALAASNCKDGVFRDFKISTDDEWREFRTAAWLHDCGKVVTPEYVVDKATKLETIYNRIHEIRSRFEILHRDAEIEYYKQLKDNPENEQELMAALKEKQSQLKDDFAFIAECNIGSEFMGQDKQDRLKQIAEIRWTRYFDNRQGLSIAEMLRLEMIPKKPVPAEECLLSDNREHLILREKEVDEKAYKRYGIEINIPEYAYNRGELYNLSVTRGTLTEEERFKINEHIIMTIKMLEELPFTDNLKRIPEYACKHHETMVGTGYPRKLTKADISIPARIMAIADIFEALTASDRPYKKPKTLSESIKIMSFMAKDGQIDADLFRLFLVSGIYMQYAETHLDKKQIDDVDVTLYI